MRLSTKVSCLVLSTCLMGSAAVYAEDLKISNDSKYKLFFEINNKCAIKLPPVQEHSITIIQEKTLEEACKYNSEKCSVNVFIDSKCTGKKEGTLVIDLKKGAQAVMIDEKIKPDIEIGIALFNIFFHGPWI